MAKAHQRSNGRTLTRYPNEKLTLVIYGENRGKFIEKPEVAWKEKTICVTGKIVEDKGRPQIVVSAAEQVVIQHGTSCGYH